MKRLLIVVDYQNDFIYGSLGFDSAINIKENIIKKVNDYRSLNDDIIFTMDTHFDDYLETEEGRNLKIKHCIKNTYGHQIQSDINALKSPKDKVFEKHTFPSLELGKYLENKKYGIVELCGLVSNICVISNAIIVKSAVPNAHIVVDALATDSYDKELHKKTMDVLEGLHIEVVNK